MVWLQIGKGFREYLGVHASSLERCRSLLGHTVVALDSVGRRDRRLNAIRSTPAA